MKVLSIIIPSYNMEKYLPKCLGSMFVALCGCIWRRDEGELSHSKLNHSILNEFVV